MTQENTQREKQMVEMHMARRFMECMKAFDYFIEFILNERDLYPEQAEIRIPVIDKQMEEKEMFRYSINLVQKSDEDATEVAALVDPCWNEIQDNIKKIEISQARPSDFTATMNKSCVGRIVNIEFMVARNIIKPAATIPLIGA